MAVAILAVDPDAQARPDAEAAATAADLTEHAFSIDADETMDNADQIMQRARHEYGAVVSRGVVIGTTSKSLLRRLVGGRYGFALYSSDLVRKHLHPAHAVFDSRTPLRELLDSALAREDEDFYHDVVVVDAEQRLVGLISTLRLVRAQSRLMAAQYLARDQQRAELERVNGSLRDSLEHRHALEHRMVQDAKSSLTRTLAGGIAHEINNKLVPIMGYAELMALQASEWGDNELGEYCATVRSCALESAQIIRQLLELSKPAAPALLPLDLREPVGQAMTFTQLRLKESDTTFELILPPDEVIVLAEATQIKQLIVNLVLNAIDAMTGTADRRLSVSLCVQGETASLAVRDSGAGIGADCIDRIFDPFFTTKRSDKGTGLGLSVCSAIVRQHEGEIAVESSVGTGSTFTVTLPLGRAVEFSPATLAAQDESGADAVDVSGARALVVDDEVGSGHLVKHALERILGLEVTWVADGEAAVELLRDNDYAVVVSDMRMPRMGGIELLHWITAQRPELASRVLFITGDAGTERTEEAHEAGIRVMLKPFKVETLAQECRAIAARAYSA